MAQISIIQKSDITEAGRFDAEYFKLEYLEIEKKLKKNGYFLLKDISKNYNNLRAPIKKELRVSGEYPYYGAQGVGSYVENYIFDGNYLLVAEDGENLRSRNNDIAFSVNGKFWVNNHAHILSFDNFRIEQVVRNYLNVSSLRFISGVAQPKLSKENLDNIKIPKNLFNGKLQVEIEKIVKDSHQKQSQAKDLYAEAENLLLTELNLLDYQPKHHTHFSTTKAEIEQAGRFDAEYFQPKYADIIKKIENYSGGFDTLDEFINNYSTGYPFKSSSYVKNGCYLIRINNMEKGKLNLENANKIPIKDIDLSPKDIAKEDDILISMSGTIGNACRVPENIKAVINQRIFRFTPKNFETEVLTLLINSMVGFSQLEMIGTGGVQTNISGNDIRKIKIPLINQNIQNKIAQKITLSHQLRKESKDLLELAKTKVEQEIENPTVN